MKNCGVHACVWTYARAYIYICSDMYNHIQKSTFHMAPSSFWEGLHLCPKSWNQNTMFEELCKAFNFQLILKSTPHIFMHILVQVAFMQLIIKTHQYVIKTNTAVGTYNTYLCKLRKNMLDIYKMSLHTQRLTPFATKSAGHHTYKLLLIHLSLTLQSEFSLRKRTKGTTIHLFSLTCTA